MFITNSEASIESYDELFENEEIARKMTNTFLDGLEGNTKIHREAESNGLNLKTYKEEIIKRRDIALKKHDKAKK